jgi:hypothetical protein
VRGAQVLCDNGAHLCGTQRLSSGDVKFTSGRVTKMFEAIFQSSDVDTRFGGEAGAAAWAKSNLNVKGFGSITDLSVAMANDIELGTLATTQVTAMTAPKLKTLRAQAGEVANNNMVNRILLEIAA